MLNTANYIDDITGAEILSLIKTLLKVFQRLNENGMTLSPSKCHLAM